MKMRTKLKILKIMRNFIGKMAYVGFCVAMTVFVVLICSPCLLIFSTGTDGEMTWLNWVGIVWLMILVVVGKKVKWT